MELLNSLLDKYKNIRPPHDAVRSSVVEVFQNTLGIRLRKNDVRVERGVVYLSIDAHIRQEVLLNKSTLLKKLGALLGKEAPKDIK